MGAFGLSAAEVPLLRLSLDNPDAAFELVEAEPPPKVETSEVCTHICFYLSVSFYLSIDMYSLVHICVSSYPYLSIYLYL